MDMALWWSGDQTPETIDQSSGFCKSNLIFYSKRNPVPLPPNQFLDVTTYISSMQHHGDTAFVDASTGRRIGFSELWRAVNGVATCLCDFRVRKGDVVLILSPNSVFFPVVCLAVMSLGAIITTANPLNTPGEIAKQIDDSSPALAFTTCRLVSKLAAASKSNLAVVLMDEEREEHAQESETVGRAAIDEKGVERTRGVRIIGRLEGMMRTKTSGIRVKDRVKQDDTAALLYSSGTTGSCKGVMLSHRNLIASVRTNQVRFEPEQRTVCVIPMFHVYGFASFAIGFVAIGWTVVILPKFEMNQMLSAVEKHRASHLTLVPPILVAMINSSEEIKAKHDLSSLRSVAAGGAPLSKEVIEGFVEKYPMVNILQGYGLTESTAMGSSAFTHEEAKRYGTAGLLAPNVEAKVVDPDTGRVLGVNQIGELWLRSPTVMKGYFRNEEATAATVDSDGWLRTGDLCYIDSEGFLYVVDRLKELIKYKGYQVPPAELEALLHTHPYIADAAVIPFPDKEAGQWPMAYIVRIAGCDLSENEVMEFIAKQVAPYKRIRRVSFVDLIPKNPSGKILRKELIKLTTSKL